MTYKFGRCVECYHDGMAVRWRPRGRETVFPCWNAQDPFKRAYLEFTDCGESWKFQHGDIEERKLWGDYMEAYDDVLEKTSTKHAPWYVIPANAKWYRNLVIGNVLADALDSLKMEYPIVDLSGEVVE